MSASICKLLLLTLLVFFGSTSFASFDFEIKAKSNSLAGKKITLSVFSGNGIDLFNYQASTFENGRLSIKGELRQPKAFAIFSLTEKGKYISVNFVIDSGVNDITLDFLNGKIPVLNLKSNRSGNRISEELNDIFNKLAATSKVNGYYDIPSKVLLEILNRQRLHLEKYPNDFASLLLLHRLGMSDRSQPFTKNLLSTFATFSDELKNTDLGKTFYTEKSELIKSVAAAKVGQPVRNFSLKDIDNKVFSSIQLKGKNYLIVFSATWCGPCQLQLPRIKQLYDKYKNSGLEVVYFNDDDDVKRWKKHVETNKLTWINVSERVKPSSSKIPRSFGVFAIPSCILVDKNGIIAYNSNEDDPTLVKLEGYLKKM